MRCAFCYAEPVDVYPTTSGRQGCEACVSHLRECCTCGVLLEQGGGRWWDDGLAYCNACERKTPKCLWCERPAFERVSAEGVLCAHCAPQFPVCDHCGNTVHGSCVTFLGKVYCGPCGSRYPLCLECGTAIAQGSECPRCAGPARACGLCGCLFADRWLVHDATWYCVNCYWRACGRCRFCQELKSADGDTRCQSCRENVVQSLAVARDLLDEVQWFCREELGLWVRQPYQFRLADSGKAIPKRHNDAYTLGLSTVGLWAARERTMWATCGYPFWFTSGVLAHEHAHAWQTENCPRQSQDLLEGFACWVEWRVVRNLGYATFAENMIRFDCPIYGRGLRRCLALEQQVGAHKLVEKVKTLRSFSLWTSFIAMLDRC